MLLSKATPVSTCRCSFEALRQMIPHKEKLDKAAFLHKTIDYIGQIQVSVCTLADKSVLSCCCSILLLLYPFEAAHQHASMCTLYLQNTVPTHVGLLACCARWK